MAYWILATICAFFIKGLCGFANTLVFTTILSFGVNNINISPVELVLGYPSNFIVAWKERSSIQPGICIPLIFLVIIGSIPGILLLKNTDSTIIKLLFGMIIIIIGMEMLLREISPRKFQHSKTILIVIGILSGILCGLYGIGALLGTYLNRVTDDSSAFKANICVVFLAENTLRLILYIMWGLLCPEMFRQTVLLFPFMLTGLLSGIWAGNHMDENLVKRLIIIMLIISGAALVATNFPLSNLF